MGTLCYLVSDLFYLYEGRLPDKSPLGGRKKKKKLRNKWVVTSDWVLNH